MLVIVSVRNGFITDLVKVGNYLVEKTQTLHALVVPVQLHVELVVVGDGGEYDADALVRLVVQVLPTPLLVTDRPRAKAMTRQDQVTTTHLLYPLTRTINIVFITV